MSRCREWRTWRRRGPSSTASRTGPAGLRRRAGANRGQRRNRQQPPRRRKLRSRLQHRSRPRAPNWPCRRSRMKNRQNSRRAEEELPLPYGPRMTMTFRVRRIRLTIGWPAIPGSWRATSHGMAMGWTVSAMTGDMTGRFATRAAGSGGAIGMCGWRGGITITTVRCGG